MFVARLRKVGGSTMLAMPPSVLETLHLAADSEVSVEVAGNSLVIRNIEAEFTLDDLLGKCDASAPPPENTGWESREAIGGEII